MEQAHIKRRQREMSKQQAIYVAQRSKGLTKKESAIMAGLDVEKNGVVKVERSLTVQEELAKARAETAKNVDVTKEDIAAGLMRAAAMAETMADPQAMVRAYSELGKMLGHYAAEKKTVTHEAGAKTLEAMKALSDTELAKLAKGRVVEGEFTDVTKEESPDEPETDGTEDV